MSAVRQTPLRDVATIERNIIEPAQIVSGTNYVGLENIESGGRFVGVRPVHNGELASNKFEFTSRHVLYGKLRPYLAKIARPEFKGVCSTDILPIRPGPDVDRDYLAWMLLSPALIAFASSRATGANLPRLSPHTLGEMRIPLPPLPEQRRIANILDKADALRAKRRAALKKLDELTQSIFLDMFGDPSMKAAPLAELCEFITDGTHQTPVYAERGVLFLSAKNVTSGFVDWEDVKLIPEDLHGVLHKRLAPQRNDILLAKNGTTGVAALVDRDCVFDIYVSLALLRPKPNINPVFLRAAINSSRTKRQFQAALKGIGVPNLHLKEIRCATVPHPPFTLQHQFAARIAEAERLRQRYMQARTQADSLFSSLQHRAFRGEL